MEEGTGGILVFHGAGGALCLPGASLAPGPWPLGPLLLPEFGRHHHLAFWLLREQILTRFFATTLPLGGERDNQICPLFN